MESSNPFENVSRTRRERKIIDAGIYVGALSEVKSLQVTDKKTQERKTKILFKFILPEQDMELAQFFNPSLADTSHIIKFLKNTCGSSFTPEIQGSAEKMWAFVKGLEGKEFHLVVTLSNGYNNVQSAMPVKVKEQPAQIEINNDDINF